jgi:single-stranded DNA-binding protein
MAIRTYESFSGFIATAPQLSYTANGGARFFVKFGQEHYRKEEDGTFTKQETTFHDLVAFRATAERAHARFSKGDNFVAEGYVRDYQYEDAQGTLIEGSEFVARKIGHDLARTNYEVDRTRRTPAPDRAFDPPATSPTARPSGPTL